MNRLCSNRIYVAVLVLSLAALGCGSHSSAPKGSGGDTSGNGTDGGVTSTTTDGGVTGNTTGGGGAAVVATLQSLSLTPSEGSGPLGVDVPFTAMGIFSDGTEQDLTASVTWASSDPTIALVSVAGLLHPVKAGTAQIQATGGTITAATDFTVTPATLQSIDVVPAASSIAVGTITALQAIGYYDDGSSVDLTSDVTWTSDSPAVVTIASGVATGVAAGSAQVTATLGAVSDFATVTVTSATLQSIAVAPMTVAFPGVGLTQQLTVTGTFSDATSQDLTAMATWTTSDATIASVSSTGLLSAVATGAATVTAKVSVVAVTRTADVSVGVSNGTLLSIAIAGPATLPAGYMAQFTASATYNGGASWDVTTQASWWSSNTAVATISTAAGSKGLALGISAGTTSLTAAFAGIPSSVGLTVSSARLSSLAVSPHDFTIAVGATQKLQAMGTFSDGTIIDISRQCSWRSLSKSVAWVSKTKDGIVTGASPGTASILVRKGNVKDTASATVQ